MSPLAARNFLAIPDKGLLPGFGVLVVVSAVDIVSRVVEGEDERESGTLIHGSRERVLSMLSLESPQRSTPWMSDPGPGGPEARHAKDAGRLISRVHNDTAYMFCHFWS